MPEWGTGEAIQELVIVAVHKIKRFIFKRKNALCSGTVSRFNEQLPSPQLGTWEEYSPRVVLNVNQREPCFLYESAFDLNIWIQTIPRRLGFYIVLKSSNIMSMQFVKLCFPLWFPKKTARTIHNQLPKNCQVDKGKDGGRSGLNTGPFISSSSMIRIPGFRDPWAKDMI